MARNIAYLWSATGEAFSVPIRSVARGEKRRIEPVQAAPHLNDSDQIVAHSAWWSRHWVCRLTGDAVQCQADDQAEYVLGDSGNELVEVSALEGAEKIAMGSEHICALFADAPEVRCFGSNEQGQLGDGLAEHAAADPNPCARLVGDGGDYWYE